jgi:signal transduction histidine kinase
MAEMVRERETLIAELLLQSDEALERRVQELSTLGEIGKRLTSSLDLPTILNAAGNALLKQTRASAVRLVVYAAAGQSQPLTVTVTAADAARVKDTGRTPMIVVGSPVLPDSPPSVVPIELEGMVIGQFVLYMPDGMLEASEGEFAAQVGAWVSLAVKNARLYAVAQQQQAQLEATNREVVQANRLKSEFLATMSHELRTPMNVIIGYTEMLLEGMAGDIDDSARKMLGRVFSNAQRLLALINDLLDLSRIEAGKMQLVTQPVELDPLLDRLQSEMAIQAKEKQLSFAIEVAPDMPRTFYGDATRLQQILSNLLSNAFKFTSAGGVTLSVAPLDTLWYTLRVRDTGIGIPSDALEFIFEQFRMVDGSPTRAQGGTGLGLAIVRNLCHLMGGRVTVESQVGAGSTFTVTLPLVLKDPTATDIGE